MILTFTPNPALDLGGLVEKVLPNEKAYVSHETRFPGGNAINAGRVIHTLGGPVCVSGFLGGSTGQEVDQLLKAEGVPTQFLPIQGVTRINITITELASHLQTRLSFPGPKISLTEARQVKHLLEAGVRPSLFIFGGSLPPGFGIPQLKSLIRLLKQKNIPWIIDSPGPALKEALPLGPLLIKPNLLEFQGLFGKNIRGLNQIVREVRLKAKSCTWVCVSSVEGGAVLVHQPTGKAWFGKGPRVKIRGHIGAGDSMVGAMALVLFNHRSPGLKRPELGPHLLRLGLAASTATLVEIGTRLGQKRNILRFFRKIQVVEL